MTPTTMRNGPPVAVCIQLKTHLFQFLKWRLKVDRETTSAPVCELTGYGFKGEGGV